MNEDKLLTAQAEDLIDRCSRQDIPLCSGFLDARQQSLLRGSFGTRQGDVTIAYFGGYDGADRVVMACLPGYMADYSYGHTNPGDSDGGDSDPGDSKGDGVDDGSGLGYEYLKSVLTVIRANVPKSSSASRSGRALSHSDYLGTLMGLGVSRSVIGDILVSEEGADIIVLREMAEYFLQNLTHAGKANITPQEVELSDLRIPGVSVTVFTDTVPSMRLDAVLASAFRMSRGKAAEAIRQGLVFVDHMEATRTDMNIAEGAELVIRHHGKARLAEIGKRTRKDRISIKIERYGNRWK